MHHRADDHARLVRAIAPRVVHTKHHGRVTRSKQGFVCVAHEVDLAVRDREHIARIGTMHAGVTLKILFRGWILLLHLFVEFLKDLNVLLGNPARAIALLRKASSTGLPSYPVYREDPHFHSLREQPEFLSLMGKLKREWEGYRQEFGQH